MVLHMVSLTLQVVTVTQLDTPVGSRQVKHCRATAGREVTRAESGRRCPSQALSEA